MRKFRTNIELKFSFKNCGIEIFFTDLLSVKIKVILGRLILRGGNFYRRVDKKIYRLSEKIVGKNFFDIKHVEIFFKKFLFKFMTSEFEKKKILIFSEWKKNFFS